MLCLQQLAGLAFIDLYFRRGRYLTIAATRNGFNETEV
jgi:hypothetical protein